MKPKISVYIATSLDGFIARKNGDIDWLIDDDEPPKPLDDPQIKEDYGYREFINSVDVLVMGRKTFEKALTFGQWPYKDKNVVVLSTGTLSIPDLLHDIVTVISMSPMDLAEYLSEQGATHIYVDGGNTIQRFIAAGLVDEMTITRIPVLIGDGIPLFGPLDKDVALTHVFTRKFENGYVQSKYRFTKHT